MSAISTRPSSIPVGIAIRSLTRSTSGVTADPRDLRIAELEAQVQALTDCAGRRVDGEVEPELDQLVEAAIVGPSGGVSDQLDHNML